MKKDFQGFANELIDVAWRGHDLNGAEIQDIAVKYNLLKIVTAESRCAEVCICAEFGFPTECYRRT